MNQNLTELVFILDRSGSMSGLEDDTIGGFNGMLEKQRKETGEALVSTVLFDDRIETLHDRLDIRAVAKLSDQDYYVRGSTALLDALGRTIQRIARNQKNTAEDYRPGKTLFVIITDGYENASREYTAAKVKGLIDHEQKKHGWEFLFLGANIDAIAAAGKLGIKADHAVDYHADARGTALNYEVLSEAVSSVRLNACLSPDWKARVEEDFASR